MKMSIREAINQTLHQEMERDERVIVLGEDVASDQGGVYGITDGLPAKFGLHRVIDTPITESAIVGAAGGAALTGVPAEGVVQHAAATARRAQARDRVSRQLGQRQPQA